MQRKRRSGRIAKELPIVLLGTDTAGKVFAEETKTVVLSRHGAGVLSKYRFSPDEVLTLRLAGSAKDADVRLVGQIGGEPGRYVYGLAFVDSNLEFWPMDFPPPEDFEPASRPITLECRFCQAREVVEHHEIEEDVYAVNGSVLRFCSACGISTPWLKASSEAVPVKSAVRPERSKPAIAAAPVNLATHRADAVPGSAMNTADFQPHESGAYSGAALETVPTAATQVAVAEADGREQAGKAESVADSAPAQRPLDPRGRPLNRRKHMRVRVNFSACIRNLAQGDDVVECENMSKGGLCFRSRRQYVLGATIEIAAPFSPGTPALFVPAKIRRAEPLGDGQFFRYGVAYLESTATRPI